MRRFIKTLFVKRAALFTVIQDGSERQFEVWCWRPDGAAPERVHVLPYAVGAAAVAREAAVREAEQRRDAESRTPALGAPA